VAVLKRGELVLAMLAVVWVAVFAMRGQPPQPPGPPIAATGSVGILVNGFPIAAEPNINFASGNGIIEGASDNPANHRVDITPNANSAWSVTHDQLHANDNFCDSVNGTRQYTCKLPSKALFAYKRGEAFLLAVDTTCSPTCTLSIDSLPPPITINQADGVTAPNGLLKAGQAKWIWYDGKVFRLL
jgi:hypothetical protein